MKITLITRSGGKIVGAFQGHPSAPAPKSGIRATLYPGPGQKFHEIDVPDDVFPVDAVSPEVLKQLPKKWKSFLSKRTKAPK
jgi:hypothetical protein